MNLDGIARAKGRLRIRRSSATIWASFRFRLGVPTGQRLDAVGLTEETEEQLGMREELSLVVTSRASFRLEGMGMEIKRFRCPSPI